MQIPRWWPAGPWPVKPWPKFVFRRRNVQNIGSDGRWRLGEAGSGRHILLRIIEVWDEVSDPKSHAARAAHTAIRLVRRNFYMLFFTCKKLTLFSMENAHHIWRNGGNVICRPNRHCGPLDIVLRIVTLKIHPNAIRNWR